MSSLSSALSVKQWNYIWLGLLKSAFLNSSCTLYVQLVPRPQGWPPKAPLLHHPQARDGGDGIRFHSAVLGDGAAPGSGGTGEVHREAPQVCHAPFNTDDTQLSPQLITNAKWTFGHHVVVWNNCDWRDIGGLAQSYKAVWASYLGCFAISNIGNQSMGTNFH